MENTDSEQKLERYVQELLHWNSKVNLVGRNTLQDVRRVHIEDSLALLPGLRRLNPRTVVDIGSGGGLPAIPLAVCLPDIKFILTDVVKKKLAFLEWTISLLGLQARAADLSLPFVLEEPCVITSRAYGTVSAILDWQASHAPQTTHLLLLEGTRENTLKELDEAGITSYTIEDRERGTILEIPLSGVNKL